MSYISNKYAFMHILLFQSINKRTRLFFLAWMPIFLWFSQPLAHCLADLLPQPRKKATPCENMTISERNYSTVARTKNEEK